MPDTTLPEDVITEAVRLTRLAHRATTSDTNRTDEATTYRQQRADLLAEYEYTARLRMNDTPETVVLYPTDWIEDGTLQPDAIDTTDNAIERPLTGGGTQDYDTAATFNDAVVTSVQATYGEVHAANAATFRAFMDNHRARRIDTTTADDILEFLTEYYPRNAWPTTEQAQVICRSLRYTLETAMTLSSPA